MIRNRPVYGGTPADFAVVQAIQEMKARGLRVTFYPLHPDGRPAGQHAPEPLQATTPPRRASRPFSLARPDHLVRPAAGYTGSVDKTATAGEPGRRLLRRRQPLGFRSVRRDRLLDRPGRRLGLASHGTALRPSLRGGGRGRRLPDRDRDARADDDTLGRVQLSGGAGLPRSGRRRALHSRGRARRSAMQPTGRNTFGHQPGDGSGDVFFHLDPLWA